MNRRSILLASSAVVATSLARRVHAARWPGPGIRLVVPFAPGGTADLIARLIAGPLGRELGTPVVIDNRAGAGGALGTELVARSLPDGSVLGIATQSTHAANPAVHPRLSYDPLADFEPISPLVVVPGVLAVHPTVPAATAGGLIELVRRNPRTLSYGTPGIGSLGHLLMAQFERLHGLELVHVPYRSHAALLADMLAGHLQIAGDNLPGMLPHLQAERLRPLATLANRRVPALPDVPTYAELGFGDVGKPAWFGLVAPARTPVGLVDHLNGAMQRVLRQPEVLKTLLPSGSEPAPGTPKDLADAIRSTLAGFRAVVAARDIRPD